MRLLLSPVTMLVISLSSIPGNFEELVLAIKGIPSFAASFSVMMVIWFAHRKWSQRFGLDDEVSVFLTLVLVFIVLVYVYPLKLIMDLMFYGFSSSWFPMDFTVNSTKEAAGLLAFFQCWIKLSGFDPGRALSSGICEKGRSVFKSLGITIGKKGTDHLVGSGFLRTDRRNDCCHFDVLNWVSRRNFVWTYSAGDCPGDHEDAEKDKAAETGRCSIVIVVVF